MKMINCENKVMFTDSILTGFSIQDLIDTAHANGDNIYETFEFMLAECIENARGMIELYGEDIQTIRDC